MSIDDDYFDLEEDMKTMDKDVSARVQRMLTYVSNIERENIELKEAGEVLVKLKRVWDEMYG
jgi:hypothetical protein